MGSFGIIHWVVVLLVVVLVFGTKKLKNIGGDLGGAIKGFKEGMKDGTASEAKTAEDVAAAREQQIIANKAADPNTIDVEAKTKS
ncbi:MAG: hypothetical protein RLZZ618_448 [Pseudomonadota bacterium]|jgi:sec-independent protein translocase protein TatA